MRMLGIALGIGSGILWAANNSIFAVAYQRFFASLDPRAQGEGLLPVLLGAAYNDAMAFFVIALCVAVRRLRGNVPALYAKGRLLGLLSTGLFGGFAGSYCYFSAISLIGAQKALVFTSLYPVVSVLLAWRVLNQKMTLSMWTGCLLSLVGVWILYGGTSIRDALEISRGVLFALGAAFCWGSEMVLASYTMRGIDATVAVLWRELVSAATLFAVVCAMASGAAQGGVYAKDTNTYALFFLGGAMAGLSYACWYSANHYLGVAKGMALNTSYILWAMLFASLYAEEKHLSYEEWMGALVLFIGIVLVVWEPKRLRRFFGGENPAAYRVDSD